MSENSSSAAGGASLRKRQNAETSSSKGSSLPSVTGLIPEDIKKKASALWHWDELPHWRRDNVYITSGYRPTHPSYSNSFLYLFHLHNESVNVWSHLAGAILSILFAVLLYSHVFRRISEGPSFSSKILSYFPGQYYHHPSSSGGIHPLEGIEKRWGTASTSDFVVFGCFFLGAVTCMGMSATFHATSAQGEEVMRWGNKLDYTGIVGLIVGSYMPALYYGMYCKPDLMAIYMTLICVLGVGCTVVSWVDRFRTPELRTFRAAMFVSLGLSGIVPVVHGVTIYGWQGLEDRMSISLVVLHGAMYIFGAFLYAFRWPERQWPGTFDIWGSSHQIFHFFVVLAAGTHLLGMAKAFDYHHTIMGSQCIFD